MNSFARSRRSPAMVVAAVALSFAIAGTAIAGPDAITRAVTKSKVKKIAKKQANKVLTQRESSLNVNSAKTAESATTAGTVNGVGVVRVFRLVPSGGAAQDVFTGGGMRLTFDCIGGDPGATAVSQVDDSVILIRNNAGPIGGVDLDAGQFLNLSNTAIGVDLIQLEFATPAGAGVTASLRIDNSPTMGANNCLISGSVIASG